VSLDFNRFRTVNFILGAMPPVTVYFEGVGLAIFGTAESITHVGRLDVVMMDFPIIRWAGAGFNGAAEGEVVLVTS
jgi:hypothetical protein